jgi:hypothetical protein
MKRSLLHIVFLPAIFAILSFAASARADAIVVGKAVADHAGDLTLDVQVDPNADPVYVADQLKSNLELTNQATIQSVTVENGVAHVTASGATPGATVLAKLNNEAALATGVAAAPVGFETRRRAYWLLGGLGGLAAVGGGGGGAPAAPLEEEPLAPTPTPTPGPPPTLPTPLPTPTSPPPVSP